MAGLVPAIHVLLSGNKGVDARHKAGHDSILVRAFNVLDLGVYWMPAFAGMTAKCFAANEFTISVPCEIDMRHRPCCLRRGGVGVPSRAPSFLKKDEGWSAGWRLILWPALRKQVDAACAT
jgi:hypothetical protein